MTVWGFTGTREGMSERQKKSLLFLLRGSDELHHGDCIGADAEAVEIATKAHAYTIAHPASVSPDLRANTDSSYVYKPEPPLVRNHHIVDRCFVLIAAPKSNEEQLKSGTWATVRYARKVGRPVIILDR